MRTNIQVVPTSKAPVDCKAAEKRSAAADMAVLAAAVRMDVRKVAPHLSAAHTAARMAFARTDAEVEVAARRTAG